MAQSDDDRLASMGEDVLMTAQCRRRKMVSKEKLTLKSFADIMPVFFAGQPITRGDKHIYFLAPNGHPCVIQDMPSATPQTAAFEWQEITCKNWTVWEPNQ